MESTSRTTVSGRRRPRVLLTTEGTYPHFTGGVSTWCDFLINGMPDADFVVWTLMMNPFIKQQYAFPSNVTGYVGVPLWGVEQPAEYTRDIPSARVFHKARQTSERVVEQHFLPLFQQFLDVTGSDFFEPDQFAAVLLEMKQYFSHWDYRSTWRSMGVWETFKSKLATGQYQAPSPIVLDSDKTLLGAGLGDITRDIWNDLRPGRRRDTADDDPYAALAEQDQAVQDTLPRLGEAIEALRWLYRLLQPLNLEVPKADVAHSAAAAFCAIPCILAKAERGTPFLLTEHGVYLREQYLSIERQAMPYHLKRFLIDLIGAVAQTSYHMADQVSPVCEFNSRWEFSYGVTPDRLRVIYNGVSPTTFRPLPPLRPTRPTVVAVGRIDPLKDLKTMLHVANRVRQVIPDVKFEHYGGVAVDEYWDEVHQLHTELGLAGTVTFNGFTDQVTEAYNTGRVTLMTSISEAFPYGVVESLMCGTPCVATDVGGITEALDGVGFIAGPRDVEALAEGVIRVLQMPQAEWQVLSDASRQRALERFTLDQFLDAYGDSYEGLASRPQIPMPRADGADPFAVPQDWLPPADALATQPSPVVPFPVAEPVNPWGVPSEPVTAAPVAEADELFAPVAEPALPTQPEPQPTPATAPNGGVADLREALADPDPFTRVRVLRSITGPEGGAEQLILEILADPAPAVRREAVAALGRVGTESAADLLGQLAIDDPSTEIRAEALSALGRLMSGNDTTMGAGA